jgi:hypothetical protein
MVVTYTDNLEHIYVSLFAWLIGVIIGYLIIYLASLIVRPLLIRMPASQRYLLLLPWRSPIVRLAAYFFFPVLVDVFRSELGDTIFIVTGQIACLVVLFTPASFIREWPAQSRLILVSGILRTLATLSVVLTLLGGLFTFTGLAEGIYVMIQHGDSRAADPAWNVIMTMCLAIDLIAGVLQFILWKPIPHSQQLHNETQAA